LKHPFKKRFCVMKQLLIFCLFFMGPSVSHAQLWTQQTVPNLVVVNTRDFSTELGHSVSLSGDGNTALMGVPAANIDGIKGFHGLAYLFKRTGRNWSQKQKLKYNMGREMDFWGHSVHLSTDGKVAVVGANHGTFRIPDQGYALVFVSSGDTLTQKAILTASDASSGTDLFGESVSTSADGSTIIVGAPNKLFWMPNAASPWGKCYIYTRNDTGWVEKQSIYPLDGKGGWFGYSTSLSADGNTALIGATNTRDANNDVIGKAYVFTRTNGLFTEQAALVISDSVKFGDIGRRVSLSADGNTAAVMGWAAKSSTSTIQQPRVYVFTRSSNNSWQLNARLKASDVGDNDWFAGGDGLSISADGRTIIMGNQVKGKAYIYALTANGWLEQASFTPSNRIVPGGFGSSASLSSDGNTTVIGAGYGFGSDAYVFIRNPNATTSPAKQNAIILSPSVVSDELNIKTDAVTTITEVQITNAIGQVVYHQKKLEQNTLHLRHLPSGIYIVSVRDTEGGISTGKIIKN
jgi:hypothetical protein